MEANDNARQDPCFVELKRGCSCAFWNFNDGGQVKEELAAEFTQTKLCSRGSGWERPGLFDTAGQHLFGCHFLRATANVNGS
uniref:Uncharacterized protein n=1 Tax=Ixodes ricinus TaxID=34613 RepID=A0A6B0TZ54_IXORI